MSKAPQSFKNHVRLVAGFHYLTYFLILLMLVAGSLIIFKGHKLMPGIMILINTLAIAFIAFYARLFALKAQDRAIRAEENFRYFILTGKPLPSELRLGQIIALRFASDEEFVGLAEEAIAQKLKPKQIKMAIVNWRGDYHRV